MVKLNMAKQVLSIPTGEMHYAEINEKEMNETLSKIYRSLKPEDVIMIEDTHDHDLVRLYVNGVKQEYGYFAYRFRKLSPVPTSVVYSESEDD